MTDTEKEQEDCEISVEQMRQMSGEALLIDIRDEVSYRHGFIGEAVSMPDISPERVKRLLRERKKKAAIVYCNRGIESRETVTELRHHGIRAWSLRGGFYGWMRSRPELFDENELERYGRQMILPEIGKEGQEKLKKARVLVAGAGGLGSPVLMYLAAAGVGTIGIVDGDTVEGSNLQRQIIHQNRGIGTKKVQSAERWIHELNPYVKIKGYEEFLTADNIEDIIAGYDFVIDGVDTFESKFLINDACVLHKKPFCHAGVIQFRGQVMTWVPEKGPCLRCVFEEIPETGVPNCSQAGILGAVAGTIGSIQALEAIKYVTGAGQLLTGRMYVFDGLAMSVRVVPFNSRSKACKICGEAPEITEIKGNREQYSRTTCHRS